MPAVLYIEREDESFSVPLDEVVILNVDNNKIYIKTKNCTNSVSWSDHDKIKKNLSYNRNGNEICKT